MLLYTETQMYRGLLRSTPNDGNRNSSNKSLKFKNPKIKKSRKKIKLIKLNIQWNKLTPETLIQNHQAEPNCIIKPMILCL